MSRVIEVVVQAARVVQQLAHGDPRRDLRSGRYCRTGASSSIRPSSMRVRIRAARNVLQMLATANGVAVTGRLARRRRPSRWTRHIVPSGKRIAAETPGQAVGLAQRARRLAAQSGSRRGHGPGDRDGRLDDRRTAGVRAWTRRRRVGVGDRSGGRPRFGRRGDRAGWLASAWRAGRRRRRPVGGIGVAAVAGRQRPAGSTGSDGARSGRSRKDRQSKRPSVEGSAAKRRGRRAVARTIPRGCRGYHPPVTHV